MDDVPARDLPGPTRYPTAGGLRLPDGGAVTLVVSTRDGGRSWAVEEPG
ncbi:hypothetical protein [Blastococcus sp. TF02A-26]|nr:hypothetical protein [Blastococcus sp. TF02A-26]